jgi:hypothetical protein
MALRSPATSAPAFESEDGDTAVLEKNETLAQTLAKPAAAVVAKPAAAVVVAPANSALTLALKKNTVLDDLQNVIDADMLEGMSFGAFPRIVVNPGSFGDKKTGKPLGDKLKVQIQSWNFVTLVTAGEKDNAEANALIRNSYDGINLINGQGLVTEYVTELKSQGYNKASAKRYIEIYGTVLETGKNGPIAKEDRVPLSQISVPPTSTGPWGAFLLGCRMAQNEGEAIGTTVLLTADSASGKGNTWGVIEFKRA